MEGILERWAREGVYTRLFPNTFGEWMEKIVIGDLKHIKIFSSFEEFLHSFEVYDRNIQLALSRILKEMDEAHLGVHAVASIPIVNDRTIGVSLETILCARLSEKEKEDILLIVVPKKSLDSLEEKGMLKYFIYHELVEAGLVAFMRKYLREKNEKIYREFYKDDVARELFYEFLTDWIVYNVLGEREGLLRTYEEKKRLYPRLAKDRKTLELAIKSLEEFLKMVTDGKVNLRKIVSYCDYLRILTSKVFGPLVYTGKEMLKKIVRLLPKRGKISLKEFCDWISRYEVPWNPELEREVMVYSKLY